jgi:hypothetical protein
MMVWLRREKLSGEEAVQALGGSIAVFFCLPTWQKAERKKEE